MHASRAHTRHWPGYNYDNNCATECIFSVVVGNRLPVQTGVEVVPLGSCRVPTPPPDPAGLYSEGINIHILLHPKLNGILHRSRLSP